MVNLEKESSKRRSRNNMQKAILASVKIAGLLSFAVVAPNSIKYLKSFGVIPGKRQKEIMARSRDRLIQNGLLKYKNGFIRLTEKGQKRLDSLEIKSWKFDKPKKWDSRWRMLIFDIPEKRRSLRAKIRLTLLGVGFSRLQDSVWIYPYDCEDFITLLKADFRVGKDLLYIIVDSIENDKNLRKLFGLPLEK